MQARKAWSEAELGIGEAFSKDYQDFNTLEVETERKPPAVLERSFNSCLVAEWIHTLHFLG